MDTENQAKREYGSKHAPIVVAAFVEAHEELFAAWLKKNGINPAYGIEQWRETMAMQYWEILGVADLALTVTFSAQDRQSSHRTPK